MAGYLGGGAGEDPPKAVTIATLSTAYTAQTGHVAMEGRRTVVFLVGITVASGAASIAAMVEWSHDAVTWAPQSAEAIAAGAVTATPAEWTFTLAESPTFTLPLYESQGRYVRLKLKADAGTPTAVVTVWRGA